MKQVEKQYDIGVIVGRFQIHELHSEHKKLIEYVLERHDKVIIFLGVSQAIGTRKNPLDYTTRKIMIEEVYGHRNIHVLPLHNKKFDCQWAKQIDERVREIYPLGSVVLYGSKDSFIPFYEPHGSFDTCELAPDNFISATDIRKAVSNKALRSKEFRAGMIYAANLPFPVNYVTIDVAILNDDETQILLGRKSFEKSFRFVGGFTDVKDQSLEQTVKREAGEETKLEISEPQYVSSRKVQDWRYRGEEDRAVMTAFFKAKRIFGSPTANDDIVETKWFDIATLDREKLVDEHKFLFDDLKNRLLTEKKTTDYLNERIDHYSGGEEMKSMNESISDEKVVRELKQIIKNLNL